ncbi:hypothetical protein EON65_22050 [archaeon]|nr:MAG: hypothetical protein EON65_22050 [archaeon]
MDSRFGFSACLFVCLLNEWLLVKDAVRLNAACSSRASKAAFRSAFALCTWSSHSCMQYVSLDSLTGFFRVVSWVAKRGVCLAWTFPWLKIKADHITAHSNYDRPVRFVRDILLSNDVLREGLPHHVPTSIDLPCHQRRH